MAMSEPIPAATLVLVRDRPGQAMELLMVRRSMRMAFAAGAMVFPGGRVDPADLDLANGDEEVAARIAAIRETLEESGIPAGLAPLPDPGLSAELQRRLHDGRPFAALLSEHRLALDLAALVPFTRWRPGFRHARVFDTRFYLAAAPAGDRPPRPQPGECEEACWTTAADVLARIERGEASAIFPTRRNLERLARFASLTDALADVAAHPAVLVQPWTEEREGTTMVCIPEGLGYPVTAEPLSSATRA